MRGRSSGVRRTVTVLLSAAVVAGLVLWSRGGDEPPQPTAIRPAIVDGNGSPADLSVPVTPGSTPLSSPPPKAGDCGKLPPTVGRHAWLPADLPLPTDTRMGGESADGHGYRVALLAVPTPRDRLASVVRDYWPARNYRLAHQEAEPHEAEAYFARDAEIVAVRVRSVYCNDEWTELVIAMTTPPRA
jgi:hypothetical protein